MTEIELLTAFFKECEEDASAAAAARHACNDFLAQIARKGTQAETRKRTKRTQKEK